MADTNAAASAQQDEPPSKKAKKFDSQGAGSRSRRSQARLNQEVKNIKRTQEGLPVACGPLQPQIRWEAKLVAGEASMVAAARQVKAESAAWKASVPPSGSVSLPSYIPPRAKFLTPVPVPPQRLNGVPMTPGAEAAAGSVPQEAPRLQATSKSPFPSSSSSSSASFIRGPFQGAFVHGASAHLGLLAPAPPAGGASAVHPGA